MKRKRLTAMQASPGSTEFAGCHPHLLQLCTLGQTVRKESGAQRPDRVGTGGIKLVYPLRRTDVVLPIAR